MSEIITTNLQCPNDVFTEIRRKCSALKKRVNSFRYQSVSDAPIPIPSGDKYSRSPKIDPRININQYEDKELVKRVKNLPNPGLLLELKEHGPEFPKEPIHVIYMHDDGGDLDLSGEEGLIKSSMKEKYNNGSSFSSIPLEKDKEITIQALKKEFSANKDKNIIFVYSGHAETHSILYPDTVNGNNDEFYFGTLESENEVPFTFSDFDLNKIIKESGNKNIMLLIDSCFSGSAVDHNSPLFSNPNVNMLISSQSSTNKSPGNSKESSNMGPLIENFFGNIRPDSSLFDVVLSTIEEEKLEYGDRLDRSEGNTNTHLLWGNSSDRRFWNNSYL